MSAEDANQEHSEHELGSELPAEPQPVPAEVSAIVQRQRLLGEGSRFAEKERVNLRLILVSGRTHEFQFHPSSSASDIANYVFAHWPTDWEEESVESASVLKLIYHGRFLHGNVTLGALSLPIGKTTVMHLVARESLPEPNSQDNVKKKKRRCTPCCGIL